MSRELQVDTSELKKVKGIGPGMTDDDQPSLVFTYEKRKMSERVLALGLPVIGRSSLRCLWILLFWWWVAR
jgi:hypothetical protein